MIAEPAKRWFRMAGRPGVRPGLFGRLLDARWPFSRERADGTLTLTSDRELDERRAVELEAWFALALEAMANGVSALQVCHALADVLDPPGDPLWVGFCGRPASLIGHVER